MSALVTVRIKLTRSNMETLESIIGMYEDSDDRMVRRIAKTARQRITKALADADRQTKGELP